MSTRNYKFKVTCYMSEEDYKYNVGRRRDGTIDEGRREERISKFTDRDGNEKNYVGFATEGTSTARQSFWLQNVLSKDEIMDIFGEGRDLFGLDIEQLDKLKNALEEAKERNDNAASFLTFLTSIDSAVRNTDTLFHISNVHKVGEPENRSDDLISEWYNQPMRDNLLYNRFYNFPFTDTQKLQIEVEEGLCAYLYICAKYQAKENGGRDPIHYTKEDLFVAVYNCPWNEEKAKEGLTFDNIVTIVQKLYRNCIKVYMFDASMYLLKHYIPENVPERVDTHVNHRSMYFVKTQDHLVPLHFSHNQHKTSLDELIRQQIFIEDEDGLPMINRAALVTDLKDPSTEYFLKDFNKKRKKDKKSKVKEKKMVIVKDIKEMFALIDQTYSEEELYVPESEKADDCIDVIYHDDIHELFFQMCEKIECNCFPEGSSIIPKPTLIICDTIQRFQVFQFNIYSIKDKVFNVIQDQKDIDAWKKWEPKIYKSILNNNIKSHYSYNAQQLLRHYLARPCVQLLDNLFEIPDDLEDNEIFGFDYNKHYTSLFLKMNYMPVVNEFDYFKEYNGHELEDYSMYLIKGHWRDTDFWLSFGMNLKIEMQRNENIEIISYLRPSKLIKNHVKYQIRDMYHDNNVSPKLRKYLINFFSGKIGKMLNENKEYRVFFDETEAHAIKHHLEESSENENKYTVKSILMESLDESIFEWPEEWPEDQIKPREVFVVETKKGAELMSGFLPVRLLLLDIATTEMKTLVDDIAGVNLTPLYAKTDEVFVSGPFDNYNEFFEKHKQKYFRYLPDECNVKKEIEARKDTLPAIGYLKFEKKEEGLQVYKDAHKGRKKREFYKMIRYFEETAESNSDKSKSLYLKEIMKGTMEFDEEKYDIIVDEYKRRRIIMECDPSVPIRKSRSLLIENEYDVIEIAKVIDTSYENVVFYGQVPGAGKTGTAIRYCLYKGFRTLFVTPTNRLAHVALKEEFKKLETEGLVIDGTIIRAQQGQFQSITFHKLFGEGFTEKTGGKRFDVSNIDAICFDEICLKTVYDISKILKGTKNFLQGKILLATGDTFQLRSIAETVNNVPDYDKYLRECLAHIFRCQIVLKESKRCKTQEDKDLVQEIVKRLKTNSYLDNVNYLRNHKRFQGKIFERIEDVPVDKVQCAITQSNRSREIFNKRVYHQKYPERGESWILQEGDILNCITPVEKKKKVTNPDTGKQQKIFVRTYRKALYVIVKIENEMVTIHLHGEDCNEETEIFVKDIHLIKKHFSLPFANTNYSFQGSTIYEPTVISDLSSYYVDNRYLNTAFTRMANLDHVYLCFDSIGDIDSNEIERRIESHRDTDIQAGRYIEEEHGENFIDVPWVKQQLRKQGYKCILCNEIVLPGSDMFNDNSSQWSINRIDNNVCHLKTNCNITHLYCNRSLSNREERI